MSRIGKLPINIPNGVQVAVDKLEVNVTGPKGQIKFGIPKGIDLDNQGSVIMVKNSAGKRLDAIHGLVRALLANHIAGVTDGHKKVLELTGVGFRATIQGTDLMLNLGFSHPVVIKPAPGIKYEVKEGKIEVTGIDKQAVGQSAAEIRAIKPPEPYKGKGIHYLGERIRRKAGKAAKAVGGAGGK